jgi:hypothetical protein
VHGLVRLELRSEKRVPHIFSYATDGPAIFAPGDSRKVVWDGGPLSLAGTRYAPERQGSNTDLNDQATHVQHLGSELLLAG